MSKPDRFRYYGGFEGWVEFGLKLVLIALVFNLVATVANILLVAAIYDRLHP